MTSAPVLRENTRKGPENGGLAPPNITVGLGVAWIVGTAVAWNVLLVAFHYLVTRLLS